MNNQNSIAETEAKIDELHEWFRQNPNLPNEIDRLLLRRFYRCMYYDIEETKKLLELNYQLRNKHTHLFLQRDPSDEDSRKTFEYADMVPMPGLTPEGYKVSCYRLCDFDPAKVRHTKDTKAFFMVTDCRFCMLDIFTTNTNETDNNEILSAGEVQIFDMTGYTLKHLSKLTFGTLRVYMTFLQDALPVRLRAIHVINCTPYLNKIVSVLKPFISAEVFKLIHFHTEGIHTLYEHVPSDMLPEEYGGTAGKMADLKSEFMRDLERRREYLMDPNHWKIEGTDANSMRNRWPFF